MKITNLVKPETEPTTVSVSSIEPGDFFRYGDVVYVKLRRQTGIRDEGIVVSHSFSTGLVKGFSGPEQVTPTDRYGNPRTSNAKPKTVPFGDLKPGTAFLITSTDTSVVRFKGRGCGYYSPTGTIGALKDYEPVIPLNVKEMILK